MVGAGRVGRGMGTVGREVGDKLAGGRRVGERQSTGVPWGSSIWVVTTGGSNSG